MGGIYKIINIISNIRIGQQCVCKSTCGAKNIRVNLTHFSATGLQRNMTTDVEIDVDQSGVHINRSCTDPVK